MECASTLNELQKAGIQLPSLSRDLVRTCVRSMLTRDRELKEFTERGDALSPSRRRA